MKSIIIGTAGHIDHGKTSLVRALTGVDADRLPEEKRRGITIDLGFAELDLGDVRIGFVDVPGHERFVKNMLAGAHGLDAVVLVVAADEGVMPQTREHFDIVRLLGVQLGLVVITKTDVVDEELLELVYLDVAELVGGSVLADAPVVAVSSRTGAGVEDLRQQLREVAERVPERSGETVARLPVDRAFTMRGFGTVVTGTLVAGEIKEGDEMELLPAGGRVRVRGVQVHGRAVASARAGQRTAINLGGVEITAVERGMVLAHAGQLRPTQIIDVRLKVLPSAPRSLRSRARVRVHLGAAEALARVQVLEAAGEIAPGAGGLVQLRVESPIVALPGERFIIRSYSPQRTVAGGTIIDAHAAKHRGGRERAAARENLQQLQDADYAGRLAVWIAAAGESGLRRPDLAARTGWRDEILDAAIAEARRRGEVIEADGVFVEHEVFARLEQAAVAEVESFHRRAPLERGLSRETLREKVFAHAAHEVFRAVLAQAEAAGALASEREVVRTAAHRLVLSAEDEQLRERLESIYQDAALAAPTFAEAVSRAAAGNSRPPVRPEHARRILQLLLDAGALVRVSAELYFHRHALDQLIRDVRDYGAQHTPERLIDVAAFKDLAGISRKYAIPLLEYLDRERVTRRAGDRRLIL